MFKYLLFLAIPLLLFSCNELSDEEMQIRLAELELMKLANEHLEEDIDGLTGIIDAKMALPENKKIILPLLEKKNWLDSICTSFESKMNSQNDYTLINLSLLIKRADNLYNSIFNIVAEDSINTMVVDNILFKNVIFSYPFVQFKSEIDTLHKHQLELCQKLEILNSDLELRELKTYNLTYINLIKKKTLRYLLQRYDLPSGKMGNEYQPLLILDNANIKPLGELKFTILSSRLFYNNISLTKAIYNNSMTIFKTHEFGNWYSDTIWLPTKSIGKQKVDIKQHMHRDTYFESLFKYEVIENE